MTKIALITGITGQDGSYLAELLLDRGYEVHGIIRRVALEDQENRLSRIQKVIDQIILHPVSLESYPSLFNLIRKVPFDECYHFAAQSFVGEDFSDGLSTMAVNINGTHYVLSALKELRPDCRFYFSGSSEMFGKAVEIPQSEKTSFHPRNYYGISKVTGYYLAQSHRENYGMHCCCGILFNHESPRRGLEFVTRKISRTVAQIKLGLADELALGDLDARRDWGHARDYVDAIYRIVQHPEPDDFVVATGETHSVRSFCKIAFSHLGLKYEDYVRVDDRLVRPVEAGQLIGDASKAREMLGWTPSTQFSELVTEMVDADLERLQKLNDGA